MKILSFDYNKIRIDPKQGNIFNLFEKNIVLNRNIKLYPYIVTREYEMRMDKISRHLYGSDDYVEELMTINDIISPYSIKEGQVLYYCSTENLQSLYTTDQTIIEEKGTKTIKGSSQTKQSNTSDLKQITVTNNNRVQIMNSFE